MDDSSKCYQRWIKMLRELKAGFHGCVIGKFTFSSILIKWQFFLVKLVFTGFDTEWRNETSVYYHNK